MIWAAIHRRRCRGWMLAAGICAGALGALSGGCGDDAGSEATTEATSYEAPATIPDDGCTASHPQRIAWSPPGDGADLVACGSLHEGEVTLENVSSGVLRVWSPSGGSITVYAPPENDRVAQLVALAVPSGLATDGTAILLPGGQALVEGVQPVQVTFNRDGALTADASMAAALAAWADDKLTPRSQRVARSVVECARATGDFVTEGSYLEDVMRNAFSLSACNTARRQILEAAGATEPPPPTALDEILGAGKKIARDNFIDELIRRAVSLAR